MFRKVMGLGVLTFFFGLHANAATITISNQMTACYMAEKLGEFYQHYDAGARSVTLNLKSVGGNLGATMEFIEHLLSSGVHIHTQVTGRNQCASACVPVFAAGHTRSISARASLFIHGMKVRVRRGDGGGGSTGNPPRCSLGWDRYRCETRNGRVIDEHECKTRAARDYLLYIRRASPRFAYEIEDIIYSSPHVNEVYTGREINRSFPDLDNNLRGLMFEI